MGVRARVRACVTAAFCSYLGSHSKQYAYQCIFKTGASGGKGARAGARPTPTERARSERVGLSPALYPLLYTERARPGCVGARAPRSWGRAERKQNSRRDQP